MYIKKLPCCRCPSGVNLGIASADAQQTLVQQGASESALCSPAGDAVPLVVGLLGLEAKVLS